MKRFAVILCIITFPFLLSSCKSVKVTSADELVQGVWQITNPSGVSASLSFDIDLNKADFKITDQDGEEYVISGIFAVDKNNLYITSEKLCKTYKFGYKAFNDRLVLEYNGEKLTLDSSKEKEP